MFHELSVMEQYVCLVVDTSRRIIQCMREYDVPTSTYGSTGPSTSHKLLLPHQLETGMQSYLMWAGATSSIEARPMRMLLNNLALDLLL